MLQHLRATLAWYDPNAGIYYWRTSTGLEVDFVIYSEKQFVAIEVKRKRTISSKDLRGMKAFAMDYPEARHVVLYGGERELVINGIHVLPIHTALADFEKWLKTDL